MFSVLFCFLKCLLPIDTFFEFGIVSHDCPLAMGGHNGLWPPNLAVSDDAIARCQDSLIAPS